MKILSKIILSSATFITGASTPVIVSQLQQNSSEIVINFEKSQDYELIGNCSVSAKIGKPFASIECPTAIKEGHSLSGWRDVLTGQQILPTDILSKTITLTPIFENQMITVTLDAAGGSFGSSDNFDIEIPINSRFGDFYKPTPDREEHSFLYWYINDSTKRLDENTILTENTIVHAKWDKDREIEWYYDYDNPEVITTGQEWQPNTTKTMPATGLLVYSFSASGIGWMYYYRNGDSSHPISSITWPTQVGAQCLNLQVTKNDVIYINRSTNLSNHYVVVYPLKNRPVPTSNQN